MKRQTKADRILNDSEMRLEAARIEEQTAQSRLNTAKAVRMALEAAHIAWQKELAPTPRKAAKKAAGSPVELKDPASDKELMCGVCGNAPGFQDHFKPSPNYHEFEGPKPVARVSRKSRLKSEAVLSDQSSGTVTDSAGVAANAASGD